MLKSIASVQKMNGSKIAVFCFGSNSVNQLRVRVQNPSLINYGATLPNYRRIYGWYSERWKGGAASIQRVDASFNEFCYGTFVYLTEQELTKLDGFEGIAPGNDPYNNDPSVNIYHREWVDIVEKDSNNIIRAVAYILNDPTWQENSYPSDRYLQACFNNISLFWPEVDGDSGLKVFDRDGNIRGTYHSKTAVFCFGSNSAVQLRERVNNPSLVSHGCSLPHYRRIFGGYSSRWEGGVASIQKVDESLNEMCYGSFTYLTEKELATLDGFEGILAGNDPFDSDPSANVYRREWVNIVEQGSNNVIHAIAYVKNKPTWLRNSYPSNRYLQACYNNISPFWPELDGGGVLKVFDRDGDLKGIFSPTKE